MLPLARTSSSANSYKGMPLRLILVVPFVLQIFAAVGIVGYLSFRNGQQAVNNLAHQLMDKNSNLVDQHLDYYLATPQQINQINLDAVELGLLDLQDFQRTGHYFWKQMQVFDVGYINFANEKGKFIGVERLDDGKLLINEILSKLIGQVYIYATDSQGNRTSLEIKDDPTFIQSEGWYANAVQAGKPVWSEIYQWQDKPEVLSISSSYPVYNKTNSLIGVIGVDLILSQISDFLNNLKISPSGKILIVERNGLVIASSISEKPFTVVDGKAQRLNILNSSDRTIQATAKYLQNKFGDFKTIGNSQQLDFKLDGEREFVHIEPWRDPLGLDWLVIIVVPESDFMEQINANTHTTIILCLVALLVATGLGMITSKWIIQPIHRLNRAAEAIADGNLDQKVEIKCVQELGILSHSFNRMALQLKQSFEELENRVEQRTADLNAAKQAAEAASQAKSDFLSNMSHELRTPLNAILGFTQLMNRDSSIKKEQQENLNIISRSGEHLLSLINDVLDMSKIEAGHIVLNENDFDLYSMLDTIEQMFVHKAESQGLDLIFERTPDVPQYVRTDERKLRQVLINLLSNAIKFTPAGGITLRVKTVMANKQGSSNYQLPTTNYQLLFEVEDTGYGIAPDEIKSLFDPFVQTETGRKSQQGTGLGLPISRKFVQLMGGDIKVSSKLGQGTIFRFDIQAQEADAANIQTQKQIRRVIGLEPGQPEYRILVADDRPANRLLLTKLLTPIGFQVREAQNGQEAIALWSEWEPHLIWMDMRMPVMNGYEAIKQIKSHIKGQATAIIALTASVFEEERTIILSVGCDDFMRKPFQENVLFEKMAQYLGVRYIYEQKDEQTQYIASVQKVEKTSLAFILQPSSLQAMPNQWVEKLHLAAARLDAEMISQLVAQIPEENHPLAKALLEKVNDFDFDQIVNLAQAESRGDSRDGVPPSSPELSKREATTL